MSTTVRLSILLVSLLLIGAGVACGGGSSGPAVIELPVRWSAADAHDLSSLAGSSDAIFYARVVQLEGQELRQLGPKSTTSGAKETGKGSTRDGFGALPVSRFTVAVTRVVSGGVQVDDELSVTQGGGTLRRADGSETLVVLEGDERLEEGKTYVFFVDDFGDEASAFATSPARRVPVDAAGRLDTSGAWSGLATWRELDGLDYGETASAISRSLAEGGVQ